MLVVCPALGSAICRGVVLSSMLGVKGLPLPLSLPLLLLLWLLWLLLLLPLLLWWWLLLLLLLRLLLRLRLLRLLLLQNSRVRLLKVPIVSVRLSRIDARGNAFRWYIWYFTGFDGYFSFPGDPLRRHLVSLLHGLYVVELPRIDIFKGAPPILLYLQPQRQPGELKLRRRDLGDLRGQPVLVMQTLLPDDGKSRVATPTRKHYVNCSVSQIGRREYVERDGGTWKSPIGHHTDDFQNLPGARRGRRQIRGLAVNRIPWK
jgi:hypothetical protein